MERKLKRKEPDTRTINIEDDYTVDFWARELKVSPSRLKKAVIVAGNSVTDVRRELKS